MQKHAENMMKMIGNAQYDTNVSYLDDELKDKLKEVEAAGIDVCEKRIRESIKAEIQPDRWAYILPGISDGCYLSVLFEHINKYSVVIVIENQLPHIKKALTKYDFSVYLKDKRLVIVHSDKKEDIHDQIQGYQDLLNKSACQCPCQYDHDKNWSHTTENKLFDIIDTNRDNLITMLMHAKFTFRNLIDNLPEYVKSAGVNTLKDKYKGMPGIMVSAGPSIDKNMHLLKGVNAVIVSALTMFKPLLREGIGPHYVTALDYHEVSGQFMDGVTDALCSTFVYEPKVNGEVVRRTKVVGGRMIFPADPLLNMLLGMPPAAEEGRNDKDYMSSGITVAHLSFGLLEYMGCDPIIMVGQDLGWTKDKYYPDVVKAAHPWKNKVPIVNNPTSYYTRWLEYTDGSGIVYQDEQMHSYLEVFYGMWRKCKARVIDCTEGGWPKEQIDETIPLAEALRKYCVRPIEQSLFRPDTETYDNTPQAIERIEGRIKELELFIKANEKALDIYKEIREAKELGQAEPDGTRDSIRAISAEMSQLQAAKVLTEAWSGTAQYLRTWSQRDIMFKELDGDDAFKARWDEDLRYMEVMDKAGRDFLECLHKCMERLKDEKS